MVPPEPLPQAAALDTLLARDRAVVWHPCVALDDVTLRPPLVVTSARGTVLTLADGRQVLDGIASWWCKSLGHGHPRLLAALRAQAESFDHVILANTTHEGVITLSERLCALTSGPRAGHFDHVFYTSDGSCGVEVALKLALQGQRQRGRPQATRIATLANGYHGETLACLSVTDCGSYAAPFASWLMPCPRLAPVPHRSGPDDPCWMDCEDAWPALAAQLETLAPELAAVIYEPVLQAAGGMRPYAPALLTRLRAWASAHGVWLIADEIASGMGRCGAWCASHLAPEALPDLLVLGKGLTGGMLPLTAVVVTPEVREAFRGDALSGRAFLHSHTFGGNALAVAVANAALTTMRDEDILGQVARQGTRLAAGMRALAQGHPQLRQPRALGMVAAVDLTAPDGSPLPASARTGWRVTCAAEARGALLRPLGDTLYLCPPLTASAAECDALLAILAASVHAVLPP